MKKENHIALYSANFIGEIKQIVTEARQKAYTAINSAMVEAYWLMGKRIVEEEQEQMWSYRTLNRNIGSQYYERLLLSHDKEKVETEMNLLTFPYQQDKLEFIKNPTEEELRREIEQQKAFYRLQHSEKDIGEENTIC